MLNEPVPTIDAVPPVSVILLFEIVPSFGTLTEFEV
ncbi:hypothetical protein ACVWZL_002418 [Bradyrhizobium sp. GM2.4]